MSASPIPTDAAEHVFENEASRSTSPRRHRKVQGGATEPPAAAEHVFQNAAPRSRSPRLPLTDDNESQANGQSQFREPNQEEAHQEEHEVEDPNREVEHEPNQEEPHQEAHEAEEPHQEEDAAHHYMLHQEEPHQEEDEATRQRRRRRRRNWRQEEEELEEEEEDQAFRSEVAWTTLMQRRRLEQPNDNVIIADMDTLIRMWQAWEREWIHRRLTEMQIMEYSWSQQHALFSSWVFHEMGGKDFIVDLWRNGR